MVEIILNLCHINEEKIKAFEKASNCTVQLVYGLTKTYLYIDSTRDIFSVTTDFLNAFENLKYVIRLINYKENLF